MGRVKVSFETWSVLVCVHFLPLWRIKSIPLESVINCNVSKVRNPISILIDRDGRLIPLHNNYRVSQDSSSFHVTPKFFP